MFAPRTTVRVLTVLAWLAICGQASAGLLLPTESIRTELRKLSYGPTSADASARYVLIRSALDGLAFSRVLERLKALARQEAAPFLAWRAAVDLARYGHPLDSVQEGRFGVVGGWKTSSAVRSRSLADAHRARVLQGAEGGATESKWRSVSISKNSGAVHVPSADRGPAVQHFITELYALKDVTVRLRLGVSGGAVASLDGDWLGEIPDVAFPAPDQLDLEIKLTEGTHHLIVTMATQAGVPCTLFARVVDGVGRRALFIDERAAEAGWPAYELPEAVPMMTAVPEAVPSHDGFTTRLRAAAVRRALGLPEPVSTAIDLRLEELVLQPDFLKAPLMDSVLAAGFLQGEHDRMAAFEALARGGPADWVYPIAAMVAMDRDQPLRARELLRGAPPASETATLARIRLALLRDRPAAASGLLAKFKARGPTTTRLLAAHFETALALGRPDVALASIRALQASHPLSSSFRSQLSDVLLDLGRDAEAVSVLLQVPNEHPSSEALRLQAALVAARAGDPTTALKLIDALQRETSSVDTLISLARLLDELGLDERSRALWGTALERRPGDPELRAEWERSQPAETEPAPYIFEASKLADEHPPGTGEGSLEILGDETHVEIHKDGGWRRYDQRVLRVLRAPDSRSGRTSALRFDPSRQQARVLRAEILRGDLRFQVLSRELYQVTDETAGFYYDLHELAVVFDDLQVGDIVTIQQRLDSGPQPGLQGAYGLLHTLHETLPKRRLFVSVSAPADLSLHVALRPAPGGRPLAEQLELHEESTDGGERRWTVRGRELSGLLVEPDSVVIEERSASLHISTHSSWDEVAAEYAGLLDASRVVTPSMRSWVEARRAKLGLGADEGPSVALARDLAVSLARQIRYVGLEFGEHSYRPYGTDQVWARRFGDCKDQANLLVTLMSLVEIDAHITLVRTRPHGRLVNPLPSFAFFDHAIVYVPQWDLYFDPTSPYHGWGDLPVLDQGAQGLVVTRDTPSLAQLPIGDSKRNDLRGTYIVTLGSDGSAHLAGDAVFRGTLAADYRARLTDESSREERLETLLNGRYPGLELVSNEMKGLEASASSLHLLFKARVSSLAAPAGQGLEVRRPAGLDGFSSRWAGLARRATALRLPSPALHELRFRYVLPPGWSAAKLPPEAIEEGAFGSYSVRWGQEAGAVSVENRFELTAHTVPVADYERFRAFLERYDAALRVPLALRRAQEVTP